jgi:hypothetical protein
MAQTQRDKSAVSVASSSSASLPSSAPPSAPSGERWGSAIGNLGELGANVESLQKLLARKAVFVDDDVFSKASLAADQARSIKVPTDDSDYQTPIHPLAIIWSQAIYWASRCPPF